nr:uncharacterized protein LOC103346194 isoform X5 [Oryctolagus cuniculus]
MVEGPRGRKAASTDTAHDPRSCISFGDCRTHCWGKPDMSLLQHRTQPRILLGSGPPLPSLVPRDIFMDMKLDTELTLKFSCWVIFHFWSLLSFLVKPSCAFTLDRSIWMTPRICGAPSVGSNSLAVSHQVAKVTEL